MILRKYCTYDVTNFTSSGEKVSKSRQRRVRCCLLRSSDCMALQKYWNACWESRGLRFLRTLSGWRILFIIAMPKYEKNIFFPARQPLMGQCLLVMWDSRSHSDTQHSVGFLWVNDQPDAEISTRQHRTLARDRYPRPKRDWNPQSQQTSGRRPTR